MISVVVWHDFIITVIITIDCYYTPKKCVLIIDLKNAWNGIKSVIILYALCIKVLSPSK